jgi:chromosome segregation ATPase
LDKGTIEALKRDRDAISANYDNSLQALDRCVSNMDALEDALRQQNEAMQQLVTDSNRAIEEAERLRDAAIARERESHERSMEEMQSEYARLYEKWLSLSAADACHESWLEVTDGE